MMENPLFNLKSDNTPWLSPSITTAAMDLILAFLCGLGLFYLITPYIPSNPPLPPLETRKRLRKCHVERRGHFKSRKKNSTMKDQRSSRKQLEEVYGLVTLLTSYIGKLHDSSSFHDLLGGNGLGEMLDSEHSADHQSPRQPEEDAFANTVFPVASPAPSPDCLQPLDCPFSRVLISSSDSLGSHTSQPLNPLGDSTSPSPAHSSSPVSSQPVVCPPSIPDPILNLSPSYLMEAPPGTTPPNKCGLLSIPATTSDIQELLEIEISNKSTVNVCQGRKRKGEDKVETSLRNVLSSLDSKQDTDTPQSFCNTNGKPEQLAHPQQHILPSIVWNHLQQDGTQLFWGLPSLHSESLVHLSWKQTRSSSVQRLSFAFNYVCPAEPQPKDAPHLSQTETLCQLMGESELWSQSIPPTLSQIHTEPHLPCFIQKHPPPSPAKIRNVRYSPLQQRKKPFILNEALDRSSQQLNGRKDLASKLQTTAEALIPPTGNLPQVSKATQTYKLDFTFSDDSMSSNILKQAVTRDEQQPGCSLRQTVSQDLMQLSGKLTVNNQCQAQCKHELLSQPSQTSAIPCKGSNSVQKIDLAMVAQNDPSKGVEHYQERDLSEDQAWSSGSTLVKRCEANLSEVDCIIPKTSQDQASAGTSIYLPNTSNKKHVEKVLTFHLGRKLNQMQEGMIPVYVRQSCLAASHASPKPNAHVTSTSQSSYKCLPAIENTSQELSFLDAQTLLILEIHIVRYRVRHKWDPQMQSSDPGTLNLHGTLASPLAQPALFSLPSTDSQVSSIAKVANSQEDLQEGLVEKMVKKMLSPTSQGPFSVHKPTELLKSQSRTLSGDIHGPAEPAPSRQDSLDIQYPTYSFLHRTRKNRPVLETGQGRLEPSPNLAVSMHEPGEMSGSIAFEEPCLIRTSPDIKGMSQLSVAETSETVEVEETPPPTGGASVIENSKVMNNGNISGSPKTKKSCSPSSRSILQDPVYTDLKSWVVREIQKQVELKLENQFQHQKASIFQHGHIDKLSTKVSLPSWASGSTSQIMTSSKISTPKIKCSLKLRRRPSQEQQETKISRVEVTGKNQSKMFNASDGRQGYRKLASGLPEERRAVLRPSQSCGLSPLIEVSEQGAIGRKTFPTSPQKAHNSTESHVHKRIQNFLHFADASTKERRQDDPLPNVECSSVTTQSRPSWTVEQLKPRHL